MAITDIKVKPMEVNWNSTDLGSVSGGVEISAEVASTDIVTDANGTSPVDAFQTGVTISISMTLIELNTANYNQMIATATGGSAAGTDATVYGYGTSKNFTSMLAMAQQLRLRPIGKSDNTEDWTFWKAVPVVESLSFAPDAANSMSVTFRIFPDSSKPAAVSLGCFGDNDGV
tara:strand:- start:1183 stop:1701 length:519 start_codon:yes stop_codon:yes gene_type:complete